jgi:hypothetical protein
VRKILAGVAAFAMASLLIGPVRASSHREAPLITADPLADNTDLYAFVSPTDASRVTLIANFIPLEAPYGGPNFFKFDDTVLYEIMIDNDGDAVEDVTYQFRFRTETRNPSTFLYNTGPITAIDSTAWNVRQFYSVTRVEGPRRRGKPMLLGDDLPTPPVNVGARSTPNYEALAAQAVRQLADGSRVFAGQREDPFFVDLNVFDLLAVPPVDTDNQDSLAGFNVHTIAVEIPIASLTSTGTRPNAPTDPHAVIGVWSTASRRGIGSRGLGFHGPPFVQISRLGQPLVNEVVIPLGAKDLFNSLEPTGDACGAARGPRHHLPEGHSGSEPTAGRRAIGNAATERRDSARGESSSARRARRRSRRLPQRPPSRRRRGRYRAAGDGGRDAPDAGVQHGHQRAAR